jgi:hypothetical protein
MKARTRALIENKLGRKFVTKADKAQRLEKIMAYNFAEPEPSTKKPTH